MLALFLLASLTYSQNKSRELFIGLGPNIIKSQAAAEYPWIYYGEDTISSETMEFKAQGKMGFDGGFGIKTRTNQHKTFSIERKTMLLYSYRSLETDETYLGYPYNDEWLNLPVRFVTKYELHSIEIALTLNPQFRFKKNYCRS